MSHMNATIQDSLSPVELAEIAQSFGLELEASDYQQGAFIEDEWLERMMGMVTSSHLWDAMWRFGIVLDDDLADGYWMPTEFDTTYQLIQLDGPNRAEELQA
jgi:hypothetical protein